MTAAFDSYGPFDAGTGANITENFWRSFMRRTHGDSSARSGIILTGNACQIYADSTGMQVKGMSGQVWIEGAFGLVSADKTIPIAAAHATLARNDRVVIRNDFVNNRIEYAVLTGTPSASPVTPSVTIDGTKWEVSAAVVNVPALNSSIAAGQVTDSRQYQDSFFTIKRLATSLVRNNSTTLTDVTDLSFPISSGRAYALDGCLFYDTSQTADAKIAITLPAGATIRFGTGGMDTAISITVGSLQGAVATSGSIALGGVAVGTSLYAMPHAVVTTVDTAGLLTLQWAQNTLDATNTTLQSGSWLRLTPIV